MFSILNKLRFFFSTQERKVKGQFDLHVLIYKEEGSYVTHCLELDIVGTGETVESALKEMRELVEAQITFHFKHGIEDKLFHPAPAEYWNKWLKSIPYTASQDQPLHEKVESLKCALVEEGNDLVSV